MDTCSNVDAHTATNGYSDVHAIADSHRNRYPSTDTDKHAHAKAYGHFNAHTRCHINTNTSPNRYAYFQTLRSIH